MAITYTTNAALGKPGTTDRSWDVPINANADLLDGLTAIGGLATTLNEQPSSSLKVRVASGAFVRSDGTVGTFLGVATFSVPASATTCLWLTDGGSLNSGPAFPSTSHVRLATVVAGNTTIVSLLDQRIQCSAVGSGLGFVLKAGDRMTGSFTVSQATTGTSLLTVDAGAGTLGFFGTAPGAQAAAVPPLTDASNGTAAGQVTDAGAAYSQAILNANFASLTAKVNALIATLKHFGLMAS